MNPPDIQASACLLFEPNRQWVLLSQNDTLPCGIASITKLMTALLVCELVSLDNVVTIPTLPGSSIGGTTGGLLAGETYTVRELLYDLFLPSDNSAGWVLAQHVGTTVLGAAPGAAANAAFVNLMNARLDALGCDGTHFLDAHGYINRTNTTGHYSTANDMMMIAMAAYARPELRDPMVRGVYTPTGAGTLLKTHKWVQENYNVAQYPGTLGCKEGYVPEIGQSLCMYSERRSSALISVTLQWPVGGVYQHGRDLHDWGYYLLGETAEAESFVEETSPAVTYVGSWSQSGYFPDSYSNGYAMYTSTVGASALFSFRGTGADWVGPRGPTRGKADCIADNMPASRVIATAATFAGQQTLFSVSGLPYGDHTLKIVAAGGGIIDIDGFRLRAHL